MPAVNLQIPLLFDISAGGIVYGENAASVDVFDSHLAFTLAANPAYDLGSAFKSIMYADASENDLSGVLFYSTDSSLSTTMGNVIQGAILGQTSKLVMKSTTSTYNANDDTAINQGYMTPGIPLPDYSKTITDYPGTSANDKQAYYIQSLTDTGGTNFGRVLIRLMATHLMGHPFAQSFIANEQDIIADISNSDVSNDLSANLLKGKKISGDETLAIIKQVTAGDTANKADGINNGLLQAMYEGLLGTAPERFDLSANASANGTDVSGGNLDSTLCRPLALPFQTNDTISFYFRPHVRLTVDTDLAVGGVYGNTDLSGVGLGASSSTAVTAETLFFQPRHRWISYQSGTTPKASTSTTAPLAVDNHFDTFKNTSGAGADGLAMTGTNLVEGVGGIGSCEFDAHVWKITLTM